jgi:osmotically-inducible protein OsmY
MHLRAAALIASLLAGVAVGAEQPSSPAPPRETPASLADTSRREAVSDSAITASVQRALRADPALHGTDIAVNTVQGVVNLTGNVESRELAAIASAHAQKPDGVMRIESHLSVLPR